MPLNLERVNPPNLNRNAIVFQLYFGTHMVEIFIASRLPFLPSGESPRDARDGENPRVVSTTLVSTGLKTTGLKPIGCMLAGLKSAGPVFLIPIPADNTITGCNVSTVPHTPTKTNPVRPALLCLVVLLPRPAGTKYITDYIPWLHRVASHHASHCIAGSALTDR